MDVSLAGVFTSSAARECLERGCDPTEPWSKTAIPTLNGGLGDCRAAVLLASVLHHRIVRETRLEAHPLGLTFDRAHDVTCVRDQNIGRAEPRLHGPVPAMLSASLLSDRSLAKTRDRIGAPR